MKAALALLTVALAGCASNNGVKMSDAEARACKAEGCGVWTMGELETLVRAAIKKGYEEGYAAGAKSL